MNITKEKLIKMVLARRDSELAYQGLNEHERQADRVLVGNILASATKEDLVHQLMLFRSPADELPGGANYRAPGVPS